MYPTENYTPWVPSFARCQQWIKWSGKLSMCPGVQVILNLPRVPGEGRGEMHKYIDIKGKKERNLETH